MESFAGKRWNHMRRIWQNQNLPDFDEIKSASRSDNKKAPANCKCFSLWWRRHPDLNWGSWCCRPMPYHLAIAPKKLERITRLELATSTLARWRSTRWAKSAYIRNAIAFLMVPPVGIEPTTRGFSVLCSTDWATEADNGDSEGVRTLDL